jgi:hypothetical protein
MSSGLGSGASQSRTWALPEGYAQLPPLEQVKELRSAIRSYLETHGSAAKSVIYRDILARRTDTFNRALEYLATTQQIYVDSAAGSRDPIYYSNGRLAHQGSQTTLDCGRYSYVIRAYDDRLAGKSVTITQYAVLPSGDTKALGGLRLDWQDLDGLIERLKQTAASLSDAALEQSRGGSVSKGAT